MKKLIFLLLPFLLFAYQVEIKEWKKGQTFYGFLKENKIPVSLYFNLDKQIQKKLRYISSGVDIFVLKNGDEIRQALIPFSKTHQLQIIHAKNKYIAKIVPIQYTIEDKYVSVDIDNFLSYDIYQQTKNPYLSSKIVNIFQDRVNFRALPRNTKIDIYYQTKSRFGKIVNIDVIYARIKNKYYDIDAYKFSDGRYYDSNAQSLRGMFLSYPMKYKYISSYFGRRFHPILHKWRMHDGIDYVNRVGTPIRSVADGKIIYRGWIRGYGNCVKIKHKNGYMTLYGHMKSFAHIRVGQYIKQGQVIGYMGNTGMSTGPHLHFGVMHYGKWINPLKIKKSAKIHLRGNLKKEFLAYIQNINQQLDQKVAMK